jgi:hypothetical protein
MSKRFSIVVREFGADTERVLCEVDRDPYSIAKELRQKRFGRRHIVVYSTVYVVDNGEQPEAQS